MKMSRISCGRGAMLMLACLSTGILLAQPALTQPKTESSKATDRASKQRQSLVSKMWWNQTAKIEELGLSTEQRGKMDAELVRYLDARTESQKKQKEALAAFGEAMNRNDKAAAMELAKKAASASALPVEEQLAMMTTVVGLLSDDQYKTFTSQYPNMLSRLWIRQSGPRLNRGPGPGRKR